LAIASKLHARIPGKPAEVYLLGRMVGIDRETGSQVDFRLLLDAACPGSQFIHSDGSVQ